MSSLLNSSKKRKRLTVKQNYEMCLHAFYNLRSEVKFKGHSLTLCDDKLHIILKDLNTEKEYSSDIFKTMYVDADEFIRNTKESYIDLSYFGDIATK